MPKFHKAGLLGVADQRVGIGRQNMRPCLKKRLHKLVIPLGPGGFGKQREEGFWHTCNDVKVLGCGVNVRLRAGGSWKALLKNTTFIVLPLTS